MRIIATSVVCLAALSCYAGCPPPPCGVLNWTGEWVVPPHCCVAPAPPPPPVCYAPCRPAPCQTAQRVAPPPAPHENGYSKESSGTRRRRSRSTGHSQVTVGAVRYNEVVKVYKIGRYVDPVDCNVMHEAHPVYRLERSAGWRLQPDGKPQVLLGPVEGLRRPEYHPEPVPGELGQQLQETRRNSELAYSTSEALKSQLEALQQKMNDDAARQNQNNALIADQIRQLREELNKRQASPHESPSPASTTM
jgi:hypothetical protein